VEWDSFFQTFTDYPWALTGPRTSLQETWFRKYAAKFYRPSVFPQIKEAVSNDAEEEI
jgi:hypothetical protein